MSPSDDSGGRGRESAGQNKFSGRWEGRGVTPEGKEVGPPSLQPKGRETWDRAQSRLERTWKEWLGGSGQLRSVPLPLPC